MAFVAARAVCPHSDEKASVSKSLWFGKTGIHNGRRAVRLNGMIVKLYFNAEKHGCRQYIVSQLISDVKQVSSVQNGTALEVGLHRIFVFSCTF